MHGLSAHEPPPAPVVCEDEVPEDVFEVVEPLVAPFVCDELSDVLDVAPENEPEPPSPEELPPAACVLAPPSLDEPPAPPPPPTPIPPEP